MASRRTGKRPVRRGAGGGRGREAGEPDIRVSVIAQSPLSPTAVRRLAAAVIAAEGAGVELLSVTIVGRARMQALNRTHLRKNRPTDVIAFALGTDGPDVGDVSVSADAARAQARALAIPVREEMRRLVVHGVLHVLGYDHPEGEDRVRSAMWRRQERYLAAFA